MGIGYLLHFSLVCINFCGIQTHQKIQTFLHFQQPNEKKEQNIENEKRQKEKITQINCQLMKLMHYKQNNQIEGKKKVFSSSSSCSSSTSTLVLLRLLFLDFALLILLLLDLFFLKCLGDKITIHEA